MLTTIRLTIATLALIAPTLAQDQLTTQALQRIEKCEKLVESLQQGDKATADRYLADLSWAAKRLAAVYDKTESHYLDAVKRHETVRNRVLELANGGATPSTGGGYDVAKLRQLDKEIGNATQNFRMLNVTHMGDASRVRSVQSEIEKFTTRLAEFPADDAEVAAVAGRFAEFEAQFKALHDRYRADAELAPARTERFVELEAKYAPENLPVRLDPPYEAEHLRAWVAELRRYRDVEIPQDVAWLASIEGAGAIDAQRRSRLHHWISGSWQRQVAEVQTLTTEQVHGAVVEGLRHAKFILESDPTKQDHVANRILGEGKFEDHMQRLQAAARAVDLAAIYDEALGIEPASPAAGATVDPDVPIGRPAERARIDAAIEHLRAVAIVALDQVRMPASASTDASLLELALETMRRPDYGVGDVLRATINSDKRHLEMKSGSVQHGAVQSTVTIYTYAWDEFQVCTAEREGDEIWLWFNTLKLYSSGDSTTPIGRWILSKRFKSTRILESNLD